MAGVRWSESELDYIRANFENMSCEEMSKVLGRTRRATQHMFGFLGLERTHPKEGERYGKLIIQKIELLPSHSCNKSIATCLCDCGQTVKFSCTGIKNDPKTHCGCERSRKDIVPRTDCPRQINGKIFRLYGIWATMKSRCNNPKALGYQNYGGRGIKVCDLWHNNYDEFYYWALSNGYNDTLTIDRIKLHIGYCPENCRWVSYKTQANNKTNSVWITAWNETKTLANWEDDSRCHCNKGQIRYRIGVGWSPELAISTQILSRNRCFGQNQPS